MNRKELLDYANEMKEKLDYHYFYKPAHTIREERIASASRLKLNLVSRLKEEYDLIIEQCLNKKHYPDSSNWFDIFIPKARLSIKICKNDVEKQMVFKMWKKYNIVLLDESKDNLNTSIAQIIDKMIRMSRKRNKKKKML